VKRALLLTSFSSISPERATATRGRVQLVINKNNKKFWAELIAYFPLKQGQQDSTEGDVTNNSSSPYESV
jgi:hypothetical protein